MRTLLRFFRLLPVAIDRAHLLWARAHLSKHNPMHPDLPKIVERISLLEDRRG